MFKLGMLNKDEARKILESANLPGTVDNNIKYSMYTSTERMKIIRECKNTNDRTVAAAIEIQRHWRGHHVRSKLKDILNPKHTSVVHITRDSSVVSTPWTPGNTEDLMHIRAKYDRYVNRRKGNLNLMSFSEFCAYVIQRWWRKISGRPPKEISVYPSAPPPTTNGEPSPVPPLQTPVESPISGEDSRVTSSKTRDSLLMIDRNEAAKVIQRSWRKHIDTQVYRYYKDLINFKTRGDPALMLRCINPREADILDSAAGVHIKFRLAGERFPPNIYYKIFTHRNIADIGAFAPRDYTHADNKQLPVSLVHNKATKITKGVVYCYKRWENNGWRLVSDRVVQKLDQDPVVFESAQKTAAFHHNKVIRKQDLEKKRKQKKIEWMKKMYKQGMLQAKQEQDSETQNIIETVAQGMVNAADARGSEAVEDWEVDELLEWTNGLNFDQYLVDWKEFATSAGSEYLSQLRFIPDDPYSFNIGAEQACQ
ncbi:uncharacterized protein C11orf65 homolog [Exaiptasia diaphana]|uniref:Uncharacterized protein n=1 Tax=Exaiptasia diaphana TaxID=2652724 RepID=A0A913WXG6_EXADI|nr:uncharacterized protein C11orf65 homolog [Exaiptasia diaphana]